MQYRKFGKLDWKVSVLGLGVMRLPSLAGPLGADGSPRQIDTAETEKIVRYAIDHGVNYLDLGFTPGRQEAVLRLLGQILQNGLREKVRLSVRMPPQIIVTAKDCERYLDSCLEWLQTERVDFLILGWLDRANWPVLQQMKVLGWADRAAAAGKIGRLGLAFHDQYQYLKEIVNAYPAWSLAQFQYSFMDVDHHPGVSGLKFAADSGLGVVAVDALRGGRLTRRLPKQVEDIWACHGGRPQRPVYQRGLSWVWNHVDISTVVVDISSIEQAAQDIALAESSRADCLTVQEEILVSNVRDAYRKLKAFPCTACRSCMPCPQGIDAPRIFELYNDAVMFNDVEIPRDIYRFEGHTPASCNECGACVKLCGRRIDIPRQLKAAASVLQQD
jgi:uncharacterized protein